jgi:hypothetical protein
MQIAARVFAGIPWLALAVVAALTLAILNIPGAHAPQKGGGECD